MSPRKPYPSDVTDEEWAFVAPYLTLMREDAPQREHRLREVFNGLRYVVRDGRRGGACPTTCRPGHAVYQQTRRWLRAGCFEAMAHDLRACCGWPTGAGAAADGGGPRQPHAAVHPRERRAGRLRRGQAEEGHQGPPGRGHARPPAGPARHARERRRTGRRSRRWPRRCRRRPARASSWPSSTRATPASGRPRPPAAHGIRLEVVKLPEAKRGFVLLPRRWVVERSFAWAARFRRLARDYERLPHHARGLPRPRLRLPHAPQRRAARHGP